MHRLINNKYQNFTVNDGFIVFKYTSKLIMIASSYKRETCSEEPVPECV